MIREKKLTIYSQEDERERERERKKSLVLL